MEVGREGVRVEKGSIKRALNKREGQEQRGTEGGKALEW